ncbi:hypothetical protein ACWDT5_04115 [Rhodococcus aetherivorans]
MNVEPRMAGLRQWRTDRLEDLVAQLERTTDPALPCFARDVARTELSLRREGGTVDWVCRVRAQPRSDGRSVLLTLALPTTLSEPEVRDAALVRARELFGSDVVVDSVQFGD